MPNWQEQAAEFAQNHNLHHDTGVYALDLVSEMGEVAKEVLLATAYGTRPPQFAPTMAGELGDMLYSLCMLATAVDVDLDHALKQTLAKYEQRWQVKGHLGSVDQVD